jgi:DNA-directed RNA polymerase specialized sigma24 family protein
MSLSMFVPSSSPKDECILGRWLEDRRRLMYRVVIVTLSRMALRAPPRLRRVLLADAGLRDDIVADAMIAFLLGWRSGLVQPGKDKEYLCAIVGNCTRTRARTAARALADSVDDDVTDIEHVLPTVGPSPEDAFLTREQLLGVRRALTALSDRDRRVFATAVDEGVAAASADAGIPEPTVRVIVHRTRKKLAERLLTT